MKAAYVAAAEVCYQKTGVDQRKEFSKSNKG